VIAPTEPTELSPASRRTRRHIVDIAIESLAENRNASLGDIADAARVSRSTLHRHFSDRAELLTAIDDECRRRFGVAIARAEVQHGTGMEVLNRIAMEFLDLGPVLSLIFADNALVDPDSWGDGDMTELVVRGHRDNTIDPELPTAWVETTLWVLLFGSWLSMSGGAVKRRDVPALLSRTLSGAFAPR
jgi:AcrR family transcriptional regulator